MTVLFFFALIVGLVINYQLLTRLINALEARHDARLKALENRNREQAGKGGQVPQQVVQPQPEQVIFNTAKTVHDNEIAAFEWGVNYRK